MNLLLLQLISAINPAVLSLAYLMDDDGEGWIILALLLAGPIFYFIMYSRYRNADKRHFHEKETPATLSNLRSYDNYVKTLKKQSSSRIHGANNQMVQGSIVKNSGTVGKMIDSVTKQ